MSLHYLLDGYNILKQMAAFRDLPLEDGRKGLLKWIDHSRPQGSVNNQVTVVFDGHPDHFGGASSGEIRVIFSDGCSADDKIKLMVEDDLNRKNCVVVSDDKDIFLYARSLGAKVMSVAAFTSVGAAPRDKRADTRSAPTDGKYISLSRQEKINKELRDFWLKEKQ
jgi:predicted RNA-binding protein with PIN domain